jgi:hypothetical protein
MYDITSVTGELKLYNVTFWDIRVIARIQVIAPNRSVALDLAKRWQAQAASRERWHTDLGEVKQSATWVAGRPHIGAYPTYGDS